MPEIPIILPEKILIREKSPPKKRKGMIDPDTHKDLKGLLDTGKLVLGQMPLKTLSKVDTENFNHLEKLLDNSISILENTDFVREEQIKGVRHIVKFTSGEKVEEVTKKKLQEIDNITKNLRRRLDDTIPLVKKCDPKFAKIISDVDRHIITYADILTGTAGYALLIGDSKSLKRKFADRCKCQKR